MDPTSMGIGNGFLEGREVNGHNLPLETFSADFHPEPLAGCGKLSYLITTIFLDAASSSICLPKTHRETWFLIVVG